MEHDGARPKVAACKSESAISQSLTLTRLKEFIYETFPKNPLPQDTVHRFNQLVLYLKSENRQIHQELRDIKKKCQASKGAYDKLELLYQNVLYQKNHLLAEIRACHDIDHLYERVDLVSREEFAKHQMDTEQALDEYHLMVARLDDEFDQRKRLQGALQSTKKEREVALEKIRQSKKELELIRDQVRSIIKMADSLKLSKQLQPSSLAPIPTKLDTVAPLSVASNEPVAMQVDSPVSEAVVGLKGLGQYISQSLQTWPDESIEFSYVEYQSEIVDSHELEEAEDEDEQDNGDDKANQDQEDNPALPQGATQEPLLLHTAAKKHSHGRGEPTLMRFKHDYIQMTFTKDDSRLVLLMYQIAPNDKASPIVLTVDSEHLETPGRIEQWLLSLPVPMAMLLTQPCDAVLPGSSGIVPFRWIQVLASLCEADSSFSNPIDCIVCFCKAVFDKFPQEHSQAQH